MTGRKQLVYYFILTILATWLLWLAPVLNGQGVQVPTIMLAIAMPASFVPSFVALGLIMKEKGRTLGWKWVISQYKRPFDKKWLYIVILLMPILSAISYWTINRIDNTITSDLLKTPWMIPLVFLQIFFIGGALGEELGWRGYALPRLLTLFSPMVASLILGLIWSFWHLPLFFMIGTVQSNMPIWQFMLQNTLIAFYFTWLYMRVNRNLFVMVLFHAIANTASAVFVFWQSDIGRYIGFGVLFIAFGIILWKEQAIFLKKQLEDN